MDNSLAELITTALCETINYNGIAESDFPLMWAMTTASDVTLEQKERLIKTAQAAITPNGCDSRYPYPHAPAAIAIRLLIQRLGGDPPPWADGTPFEAPDSNFDNPEAWDHMYY